MGVVGPRALDEGARLGLALWPGGCFGILLLGGCCFHPPLDSSSSERLFASSFEGEFLKHRSISDIFCTRSSLQMAERFVHGFAA